ncbi:SAGA-associated factor 29-like [Argiope bruennichi]|uniref:SAGA-associated factor 29 like protein n=1 Tax=Argiope bruennichi TaxID=94029 RepID=A0A8T0FR35_ARGBR|nr:SAGA-associated factor 29-like [Argiope bruennichi]KAF8792119.1 SAGA-associated factor 29 like protein [Argiope bruennichi]
MAEKNMALPPEMESEIEALKGLLLDIQESKTDPEELAAISKNEADLNAAGKKPKQSIVKSQLTLYKKELQNTTQEIERIHKALEHIAEMRKNYFSSLSTALKGCPKEISAELAALKETAETLPLWVGENDEEIPPLCGAVQTDAGYVAKPSDMVAAFVTVKHRLHEWILAEVINYDFTTEEYKIQDIDEKQKSTYVLKKEKVIPLPNMRANPVENPNAIFPKGTTVLALYENTTCFYKGVVHEPPGTAFEPYQISFEDNDCEGGYSPPINVPQRYVLAFRSFETE